MAYFCNPSRGCRFIKKNMGQSPFISIQFSCHLSRYREGEQFAKDHSVTFIIDGQMTIADENGPLGFDAGDIFFCPRNKLVKFSKQPPKDREFRSVTLFFDQQLLRSFAQEIAYVSGMKPVSVSPEILTSDLLKSFMKSLRAYQNVLEKDTGSKLLSLKMKEAILLLIGEFPKLTEIIFDFSQPGKIDLEQFMKKNYHFKVSLERFAFLTGRSLSTFKRDFEKTFKMTPSRWLTQRRLEEAYFLIKEKHKSSSEIYLEVGFEDLSHFSYAFKKMFGIAPSLIS
jgi:AraC-like DNA-binding protein